MNNYSNNKKRIILGAPDHFGIVFKIYEELELLGFEVQDFIVTDPKFRYKSLSQRLYNCYRKVFLNDYNYKKALKAESHRHFILNKLSFLKNADYALIIRPDLYPLDTLLNLKNKVDKLIGYQWDGLDRYPFAKDYIEIFDKFYVFDPLDLSYKNVLPTTNFHMVDSTDNIQSSNSQLYYLGSYEKLRWKTMSKLTSALKNIKINKEILLFSNNRKAQELISNNNNIKIIESPLTYHENLIKVKESSVLLDLHNPIHQGLSFRIFESLGYNKKLITTNDAVKDYDFYKPENILVWDNHTESEISDFLNQPYQPIPALLKKKYSLKNWIKYMLNVEEYIPIDIPQKTVNM